MMMYGRVEKRKAETSLSTNNEAEPARKRRATYTEEDAKLAHIFEGLADERKETRIQAALELIEHAKVLKDDASVGRISMKRILTRLFRGLCSNRKAARVGYFTTLVEILQVGLPSSCNIETDQIILLIDSATEVEEKASKQEQRDHVRGRLIGYSVIFHSGSPELSRTPVLVDKLIKSVCEILVKNHALRQECCAVLCEIIRTIRVKGQPRTYVRSILDEVCSVGLAKSPEGLAIWLQATSSFPDLKMPKNIWHHRDPLSSREISNVASILKRGQPETGPNDAHGSKQKQHGARQAAPHMVWSIILDAAVTKSSDSKHNGRDSIESSYFRRFWFETVDDVYFASNASLERKSLGLQIFAYAIEHLPTWTFKTAYSPKLSGCLCNQAAKSERFLNKTAAKILKSITSKAQSDPEAAVEILRCLLTRSVTVDFDKRTNSKTVNNIITGISRSGVEQLVNVLLEMLHEPEMESDKDANIVRQSAVDSLLTLVRNRGVTELMVDNRAASWLKKMIEGFTDLALIEPKQAISNAPSQSFRDVVLRRLSSCLSYIVSADRQLAIDCLRAMFNVLRSRNNGDILSLQKADDEVLQIIEESHTTLEVIKASRREGRLIELAYELLISMTLFQAYTGETDAFSVLERLKESYGNRKDVDDGGLAADVVVEEIMGFVSRQSVFYRKLAEQTFGAFASELSSDSLSSLLDVLGQNESLTGQQALFEAKAEQENDMTAIEDANTSEEDFSADADDVELVNGQSRVDDEAAQSSETSDDEAEEDDMDGEAERFEKLLAETLKTKVPAANGDKDVLESESSSDESMNDEQMMALEPQLTRVFQERKKAAAPNKKQEHKDAKQTVIQFKNRVLDLLLIYVKQQYANPLTLDLILPVLGLIRTTTSKQVSDKAADLLRQFFETAKSKRLPSFKDSETVHDLVIDVHNEALRFHSKLHASACSRSSLFLAKCLVNVDMAYRKKLGYMYADTMERAIEEMCGTPASFWTDFSQWQLSLKKSAV